MYKYFVVSHTHWDREWYLPLESMKLRLCDLMDHCLEILEREPEYIFHLDAQTVVLEDYLEIRPDKRPALERYIHASRLIVGPWYLQNDFYLTSGEATVRNLLIGRQIANGYGNCGTVGYAPDQFGNISQLPQILRGFGIDNFVFARGYNRVLSDGSTSPCEFTWEAPDGSRVLAVYMRNWYNNAQHISAEPDKAEILIENALNEFGDSITTPYVLLMNGVDHLEPQPDLLPALKSLCERGYSIRQSELSDYIKQLQSYFAQYGGPQHTYKGEMRQGGDGSLLKGTLSSRYYLKAANVRAQTMLENRLEPLYSMLELSGLSGTYSIDHFRYMWKQLLKNHPHDSICGCSCDEVHKHMEDNYARLETTCEDMLQRGMKLAASHLGMKNRTPDNYMIAVANTTQSPMDTVVELNVDIPKTVHAQGIFITDNDGNPVQHTVLSKEDAVLDGLSPLNLPDTIPVDRFKVSMQTGNVNPFAFKGYIVEPTSIPAVIQAFESMHVSDNTVMENAFLKVIIYEDGRVELFDKNTGHHCSDLLDIEDTADRGDAYVYIPAKDCQPIFASSFPASVTVVRSDELVQEVVIQRTMYIPECFDFARGVRSEKKVAIPVSVKLQLNACSQTLDVATEIDNASSDHRMRLLVRTEVISSASIADIAYDIVSHTANDHPKETWSKVLPNSTFAAVEINNVGLAVFTEGAHEYEHIESSQTLAFTLIRATGVIGRDYNTLEKVGGEIWFCPENQCVRKMQGHFGICPYAGNLLDANIPVKSAQFRAGMNHFYISSDERRFMQGRPAVQDSRLQEYFFHPDPYANTVITDNHSVLTVEGNGIVVTALKKKEEGNGIILRTVNLSSDTTQCAISTDADISMVNLDEVSVISEIPVYSVKPKKITTLQIRKGNVNS